MKIVKAQSVLEYLVNLTPGGLLTQRRAPVTNKEAEILYKMWKATKPGRLISRTAASPIDIKPLRDKGLLKEHSDGLELTTKAKNIIRNIVLYSEVSTFSKKASTFNYQEIYAQVTENRTQRKQAKHNKLECF